MRLLLVEDEAMFADMLKRACQREGWSVDVAGTGEEAIWNATAFDYDVIALDIGLPAQDGYEVCRALRSEECWTPILFLTARDTVVDRVAGLDAGADDYLSKPFALEELAARLRALSRRTLGQRPTRLTSGDLAMDVAAHTVDRAGESIVLSAKEFAVLELLLRRKGETVTRSALLDHAWDADYDGTSNIVDVYIRYLRNKVDRPFGIETITTLRGVGYRLDHQAG